MKTEIEINQEITKMAKFYKTTNNFGQSVTGQKIALLCWVLGMDYNKFHKDKLEPLDKSRWKAGGEK